MSRRTILSGIDQGLRAEDTGLQGMFKKRYPETVFDGQEWIKNIPEEERKEFGRIGANHTPPHAKAAGGRARDQHGQRDYRGRFVRADDYQTGPGSEYNPDFSDSDELPF